MSNILPDFVVQTLTFMAALFVVAVAAGVLLVVAILTVDIYTIPKGLSFLDWLDYLLYLPQTMYVLLFIWLVFSGPGPVSIDYILARSLGFMRSGDD